MANLNPFRRKLLAVVVQTPRSHVLGRAVLHAHDNVAVPRPGVIAVIFAWPRRIVSPVDEGKELQNLPLGRLQTLPWITLQDQARITPEQRSAAFVRVSLR